ncbi:MAG: hypothetical protein ABL967_18500 [Bryobacteraceae bacterium]
MKPSLVLKSLFATLLTTVALQAQAPPPALPPQALPQQDINVQFLGEMLRSATNMHDVVRNMQLEQSFAGRDQDPYLPPPERHRRELARTAAIMGAGAGAGVAIGAMTHSEKGLLIGALVGTAGGLVIDQILRHKAEKTQAVNGPPLPPAHELRERGYDRDRDDDRMDGRRQ